ncbi:MAG: hypothetical protein G01um1014106_13 [Parcubacteria group bacterium Gr01-1014_106]|nr:MAG: hypothetical protein G01um1014106_13 [Parcubacteria group bacterium Gr01-1014_106]
MQNGRLISGLITALRNPSVEIRALAAELLGNRKTLNATAVSALVNALHEKEISVRVTAAIALSRHGRVAPEAVTVLVFGLKDEKLYWEAARALGRFRCAAEESIPFLLMLFVMRIKARNIVQSRSKQ